MWVPKHLATTDVLIKVYDGLDENGSKSYTEDIEIKAAVFHDFSVVYTNEGEKKSLAAKAYVFEGLEKLKEGMTGTCFIEGREYDIANTVLYSHPSKAKTYFLIGLI